MPKKSVTATENGAYPPGLNWTVGETRTIEVAKDAELPGWLSVAKASPKKSAKKADAGTADEG